MSGRPDWVENLHRDLRGALSSLNHDLNHYTAISLEERFSKIRSVIETLDPITETKPKKTPDICLQTWKNYVLGGESEPDLYTIRQLCWEPDVATNKRFLKYLIDKRPEMTARSIRGLVYSVHAKWATTTQDSMSLECIKGLIETYRGSNKWMGIWKGIAKDVAGKNGPELFAKTIVEKHRKIQEAFKERNVFLGTEYHQKTLHACVDLALQIISIHSSVSAKSEQIEYLQSELFSYCDISPSTFKDGIARLILNESLERHTELVDRVKDYVLRGGKLGDPRLSMHGIRWAGVPEGAKSKVIEWLSRADIVFFFDNVLPRGSDRHGRKDFWLRYVKNFTRTRCLLGNEDNTRLVPIFRRTQAQIAGYGRIRGQENNSAFLLDFGNVVAVEFSRVGACYLYEASSVPKKLKDFWTSIPFSELDLKSKHLCIARIRHIQRWQDGLSQELAKRGIRPR